MKWFRNWFDKQVVASWARSSNQKANQPDWSSDVSIKLPSTLSSSRAVNKLDRDATMNFRMHKAENGWVVEMHGYDSKTDQHFSRLNLILDGEDFDKALSHVVTMQALRNN